MKKLNFLFGLATMFATVFTFSSCSSEELSGENKVSGRQVNFTSAMKGSTRATSDPQSTTVPTGQKVGVFGISDETETTMNNYNNIEYTVPASGNLTTTNAMTWPTADGAKVNFYAYAPYNDDWTSHTTAQTFTVASDQSAEAGYLASDLLYATPLTDKTVTTDALALAFVHKMAKLNITLNNTGTSDITISSVKINNTFPSIAFTPSDGTLGATSGTATDITAASNLTIAASETATVCAVIVPQPIEANTTLVTITTSDNKTLIAKLGSGTTFASGDSYNFTVNININNATPATTEVLLSTSSTAVTDWTSNTLGYTLQYGIGDYVLTDGTFLKKTDADFETKKSNAVAVIFSTTVSTTDATRGYNTYAMGLATVSGKNWGGLKDNWPGPSITNNWNGALAELDGLQTSASILNCDNYTGLSTENQLKVLANLSNYTLSFDNGVTNVSGWFTPSIGQMIQILNNLGGAGLDSSTGYAVNNSNNPGWGYKDNDSEQPYGDNLDSIEKLLSVQNKINEYVTATGQSSFGNELYATVTQAGDNFWQVSFQENTGYNIGRNPRKIGVDRVVIPCVALILK